MSTRLAAGPRGGQMGTMADKKKEREERLAKALRENLKRRKAAARALADPAESDRNPDRDCDKGPD